MDVKHENIEENKEICRTCLEKPLQKREMHPIFERDNKWTSILWDCVSIQVNETDGLPQYICQKCSEFLLTFKTFKDQCRRNEIQLKTYNRTASNQTNSDCLNAVKIESIQCEDECLEIKNEPGNRTKTEITRKNQCHVCAKIFASQYSLKRHKQTHAELRTVTFSCEQCAKNFVDRDNYRRHLSRHENPPKFTCTNCPRQFYELNMFVKHVQIKHKLKPTIKCPTCDETFYVQPQLTHHAKRHMTETKRSCTVCGKYTKNINVHMLSHSNVKQFACVKCTKAFKAPFYLKIHMEKNHMNAGKVCPICGKRCKYPAKHMKSHENDKMECDICGKSFAKHILPIHKRNVHNPKRVSCNLCGKLIKHNSLAVHVKYTHQLSRPFVCNICAKAFKKPIHLRDHVRRHTDVRPFECAVCAKTFRDKSTVKCHMMVHSGERPHKCHVCKKAFRQKSAMKTHLSVHFRGEIMAKEK